MKTKPELNDEQLIEVTRGLVSRHTAIPPTPRDTLAVLRQAAEQQRETHTSTFNLFAFRWAPGLALLALAATLSWWWHAPKSSPQTANTTTELILPDDLGLDLADWELEFTALWDDVSDSLSTAADNEEFGITEI